MSRKQRRPDSRQRKTDAPQRVIRVPSGTQRKTEKALSLFQSGRRAEAIDFLRAEVSRGGDQSHLLSLLGAFEVEAGMADIGLDRCRQAALKAPKNYIVLTNYGAQLVSQGYASDAIRVLDKALEIEPRWNEARFRLAQAFMVGERFEDAERVVRSYIEKNPDDLNGYILLSDILDGAKKHDAAKAVCIQLIDRDPSDISHRTRYANLLMLIGDVATARSSIEELIGTQPSAVNDAVLLLRINLAALSEGWDAAINMSTELVNSRPGALDLAKLRRTLLLAAGRFEEGWQAFCSEPARLEKISQLPHRAWRGEDCKDRTLLIRGAEGVGDQLLFSQLFPRVRERVKRLIVECDYRLLPLFARSFAGIEFVPWNIPPERRLFETDIDLQCLPRDLGQVLLKSFDDFSGPPATLAANPEGAAAARDLRKRYPGKRLVGISWRSSSASGVQKSVPLADWGDILNCPDVQFVDLQYGSTESEAALVRERLGVDIVSVEGIDKTNDIDQCIGLISQLDLVITVSNVTAHYAGNAGTPVWVLVSKLPLWHWFAERSDSPWYPAARLYRQKPSDGWGPALREIADDLGRLIQSRPPTE